jgi:predicted small metal-binding protein
MLMCQGYYGGSPGNKSTSWAPIMGAAYRRTVSKFSNGDYSKASNTEDDLARIASKVQYRPDDVGNTISNALPFSVKGLTISASGVIGAPADIDMFYFLTGSGAVSLSVTPFTSPRGTAGNNLDVELRLLSASGALIATSSPTNSCGASVSTTLVQGTYYVSVAGTGNAVTPYSAYGSLGQYAVTGFIAPSPPPPKATTTTAASTVVKLCSCSSLFYYCTFSPPCSPSKSEILDRDIIAHISETHKCTAISHDVMEDMANQVIDSEAYFESHQVDNKVYSAINQKQEEYKVILIDLPAAPLYEGIFAFLHTASQVDNEWNRHHCKPHRSPHNPVSVLVPAPSIVSATSTHTNSPIIFSLALPKIELHPSLSILPPPSNPSPLPQPSRTRPSSRGHHEVTSNWLDDNGEESVALGHSSCPQCAGLLPRAGHRRPVHGLP